ncbi:hypothetical protein Zm00014a_003774 [Zea mays]|uniref:Uncharacterized protein n=1 Tax=Zea mays TaxID=4577 RepID=A0A3L6DL41_MAIZE|nr:hypothetical protein Zm00014a_003774 [Zea mays]
MFCRPATARIRGSAAVAPSILRGSPRSLPRSLCARPQSRRIPQPPRIRPSRASRSRAAAAPSILRPPSILHGRSISASMEDIYRVRAASLQLRGSAPRLSTAFAPSMESARICAPQLPTARASLHGSRLGSARPTFQLHAASAPSMEVAPDLRAPASMEAAANLDPTAPTVPTPTSALHFFQLELQERIASDVDEPAADAGVASSLAEMGALVLSTVRPSSRHDAPTPPSTGGHSGSPSDRRRPPTTPRGPISPLW